MPFGFLEALACLALAQTPATFSIPNASPAPSGWEWTLESRPTSPERQKDARELSRSAIIAQADGLTVRVLRPESRGGSTAESVPLPQSPADHALRVPIDFNHSAVLNLRIRQPLMVTMDHETAPPGLGRQVGQFGAGEAPSGPCWTLSARPVSETAVHVRGDLEVIERRIVDEMIEGRDRNDQPVVVRLSRPVTTTRTIEVDRVVHEGETLVWSEGDPLDQEHGPRRIHLLTLKRLAGSPPAPAPKDAALTRAGTTNDDTETETNETAWQTRVYFVGDLAPPHPRLKRPDGQAAGDLNAMAERIRRDVAPETWELAPRTNASPLGIAPEPHEANGVQGTIQPFHLNESLIIRQTLAVHRRIAVHLDELRTRSAKTTASSRSGPQ